MKITKDTPIHYFIKDESNSDWYNIELESYLEIPQPNGNSDFKQIEDIRLFMHTDIKEHEVCSFQIHFGRNDCQYSGHKNLSELKKLKESDPSIYRFKLVSKEEYFVLRNKLFDIYLAHPATNFDMLQVGSEFVM